MKRVEAKILENEPEDPRTEPDQEPNTWLIQGKLSEDVLDWENGGSTFSLLKSRLKSLKAVFLTPVVLLSEHRADHL
jgi:hypothetical protein